MGLRRHLVWDWNGTLLDDLPAVVAATNASLATVDGPTITACEHRRRFRRPISDYYSELLGRPVDEAEFARLDKIFHDAYQSGLARCELAAGATEALAAWRDSQSLLSMWFHADLVVTVAARGLAGHFCRVDGLRCAVGGGLKEPHLREHLRTLKLAGTDVVMIGDTVDDARAAASVGARCVLYAGGFSGVDQLRATGAPVVDTLAAAVSLADRS